MTEHRPPSEAKAAANELAQLLAGDDGSRIARLMLRMQLFGEPAAAPAGSAAAPGRTMIGVWEAETIDGETHFVRPERYRFEWRWWADVDRISPRRAGKKRVVLIGESVAHGWTLAPAYTPAKALAAILDRCTDEGGVEVIDLTRINMTLPLARHLHELTCQHLSPDAVVHFFGNNWHPTAMLPSLGRHDYAPLLRGQGGPARLIQRRKEQLCAAVGAELDRIASASKQHQSALFFVMPDFNLSDWRDEWYTPWLENGKTADWHRARREAEAALAASDIARAEALAGDMNAWDQGTGGAGYAILARCRRAQGRTAEVRGLLEKAWDALFLNPALSMPRLFGCNRETLLERAAAHGVPVVNLQEVFASHLSGELPDRRLFTDYCHLTAEGMQVAMAAVAEAVAHRFDGRARSWRELVALAGEPKAAAMLQSRFATSFQNLGFGQEGDILLHDLLPVAREAKDMVRTLLAWYVRPAPVWMSREFDELARADTGVLKNLLLAAYGGESYVPLSPTLLEVACRAAAAAGDDVRAQVVERLAALQGFERQRVDLLHPRHWQASMLKRDFLWWEPSNARLAFEMFAAPYCYHKAHEEASVFWFVGEARARFSLTCRIPSDGPAEAELLVEVNGRRAIALHVGPTWRTQTFVVEPADLRPGVNELRLRWPTLASDARAALDRAAARMEQDLVPDLYPVFGEIHAFSVELADGAERAAAPR